MLKYTKEAKTITFGITMTVYWQAFFTILSDVYNFTYNCNRTEDDYFK